MTDISEVWAQAILPINSTIRQAVQVLNETSLKIVLAVNGSGVLVGTISDGDIRRGLLRGLELTSTIDSILHQEALVVPSGLNRDVVLQLMTANKIQQIPIVDENLHVIGLHLWDQISSPLMRENIMVIMAGGKGTRLHPQTDDCPKPLLLVRGKPILEHIINRARAQGFRHFVLAVHYLGDLIMDYFGNGQAFGVEIEYLRESIPLGTAGALGLLQPIPSLPFLVTNGDVMTEVDYAGLLDFHALHDATATVGVKLHEWQNPYGVVQTNGLSIVEYTEKPIISSYINSGVYAFNPRILEFVESNKHLDMSSLLRALLDLEERIVAYPMHEQWIDVGSPSDLQKALDLK